ncbi:MAG: 30S ribosomal protein S12 methylthiotransferase RimO [Candidatus Izimaplasma sp.]|nr:30S ribosomal protein S12 methylthiotransferase RimO [Candidatus Izimaplasma bacterium]
MKIGFISLGCAKNLVDSEMILGILKQAGCEIVSDPEAADAIFINTCGFIESAKNETINTIKEMSEYNKKLIVTGCYAKRYKEKLLKEMPFIDKVITLADYPKIHLILNDLFSENHLKFSPLKYENRLLTTSRFSPYVKIGEGCNNNCTYCAIPLIRGRFKSKPFNTIIEESKFLAKQGAKEINLISQDTSRYGSDLTISKKSILHELVSEVSKVPGIEMVRFLYLYPDEITDDLIEEVKTNPKIASYFDVPIQHISDRVLKKMNRRGDSKLIKNILDKIRNEIPEAIIRTTYIVGFPGETEADFEELYQFTEKFKFDRLGVFAYSKEEDTPAYKMPDQVSESIKQERLDRIMKLQNKISRKLNKQQINKIHKTLVENYDPETKFYYGRSYAFAPDDIDGMIVFQSEKALEIGDFVNVKITTSFGYDLIGDAL